MSTLVYDAPDPAPLIKDNLGVRVPRAWTVQASSRLDALAVLKQEAGWQYGSVYRDHQGNMYDYRCVLQAFAVSPLGMEAPTGGTQIYYVRADFSYTTSRLILPPQSKDTPRYWIEQSLSSEPADVCYDGITAITNTSDEPFYPPPTITVVEETLCIEWNRYSTSFAYAYSPLRIYANKVNQTVWFGAPPECLKCLGILVEEVPIPSLLSGQKTFRCTGRWAYREPHPESLGSYGGWVDVRWDRGRRRKTAAGGGNYLKYPFLLEDDDKPIGADNQPVHDPKFLDGSGQPLKAGQPKHYLFHRLYGWIDFHALGLGG